MKPNNDFNNDFNIADDRLADNHLTDISVLPDYVAVYKILAIGDSSVGKTSLLRRYVSNQFSPTQEVTVGCDFQTVYTTVPQTDEYVKLQLWDCAGQERFRSVMKTVYRNTRALLYVFDITSRASFDSLARWNGEIDQICPENTLKVLVANKMDRLHGNGGVDVDLMRQVTVEEARDFAARINVRDTRCDSYYFEISAKSATTTVANNITKLFEIITTELYQADYGTTHTANNSKKLNSSEANSIQESSNIHTITSHKTTGRNNINNTTNYINLYNSSGNSSRCVC